MTKEQYEQYAKPYQNSKSKQCRLIMADKLITSAVFFSYPLFLVFIFFTKGLKDFICAIAIPAVSFFLVSLFRKRYSAPRPYELWGIVPLLPKDTKGKSFPSRHVFSVFMIGMTYFHAMEISGIIIFLLGIILAYIRVIGGVHFPKDVVAGALLVFYLDAYFGFYNEKEAA